MEYALIFFETDDALGARTDPDRQAEYWGAWTSYIDSAAAAGLMRGGNALQPPETSTIVRIADGKRQVQDGPFADVKEHLGGLIVIDVPTLDDALEWASRAPSSSSGYTEVRPVLPPMS